MSARKTEPGDRGQTSARNRRSVRASRGGGGAPERLSLGADSACLADRRRAGHRQGDAGLSDGALRAGPSQSTVSPGAARRDARGRSRRSRGAADRRRRPWRAVGARARPQRPRRDADRDHRRRDARDDFVLRLDRGGGGLAGLHRRYRRRAQSERGERALENPGGAAAAIAVPAGQPRAVAGAADHFVPLPQIAVAAAGRSTTSSAPPPRRPISKPTIRRCRKWPPPPRAAWHAR